MALNQLSSLSGLKNSVPGPRGSFRYNPSVGYASPDLSSLFNVDNKMNPLGLLPLLGAIPSIFGYGEETPLEFGAGDILNFGKGAKQRVHSGIDLAKSSVLSGLYGKGLYKSGAPVGDVANLEGQRGILLGDVDNQLSGLMMALNELQLKSDIAGKERQGDIGELLGSLAMTLPFLL